MKKFALVTFLFLALKTYAQDKVILLEGENTKHSLVADYNDLGEAGLLLRECIQQSPVAHRGFLSYYSASGDRYWRQEIRTALDKDHYTVASPDGSFVYAISFAKKPSFLQIKRDGSISRHEPVDWKSFAAGLQTIYADNNYLYFLNSYTGNEYSSTKKGTEKLVMQRLKHSDFTRDAQLVDLPPIQADEKVTFWSFLGQSGNTMYLHSKYIDSKKGIVHAVIVGFRSDFSVDEPIIINLPSTAGKELILVGTHMDIYNRGIGVCKDMDFEAVQTSMYQSSSLSGRSTNGAYASVVLDSRTGEFYVYCFAGKNKASGITCYLSKFNATGAQVWETSFKTDSPHTSKLEPLNATLNLVTFGDATINLHEVSAEGMFVTQTRIPYQPKAILTNELKWRLPRGIVDGKPSKSLQQILSFQKVDVASNLFMNFISSKSEMTVVVPKKGPSKLYIYE